MQNTTGSYNFLIFISFWHILADNLVYKNISNEFVAWFIWIWRAAAFINKTFPKPHRSSHQRSSVNKAVLKNFAIFTGKHLCCTMQVFSCEHCEILKNTYFEKTSATGCFWPQRARNYQYIQQERIHFLCYGNGSIYYFDEIKYFTSSTFCIT